ncbi:MAG: sel1 repeat family protein [Prevotella sp.]|nr:sel1 repeat family protein [Prevotella sp.]
MIKKFRTITLVAILTWFWCMSCNAVQKNDVKNDSIAQVIEKANNGDALSQNTLGLWYYTGTNVEKNYRTAFELWGKSAQQGNVDAIGNMAICYQLGNGTEKDSTMAFNLYISAIKKGNVDIIPQHEKIVNNTGNMFSTRLLYECYKKGIGVKRDEKKATAFMEKIAENGDTEMQFTLALQYLNSKQSSDAAKWFKLAATSGKTEAIYYYGYLLYKGMGVTQDKKAGIEMLQKAADNGFVAAHRELGLIYYNGDGVEQDYDKAVAHLKISAGNNDQAAYTLALCYLNGTGVTQDYYFAMQWIAEAARAYEKEINTLIFDGQGEDFYNYIIGMKSYFVDKDYSEAIKSFKKVKNVEGLTMLAVCYANKNYEKRNSKKAASTFEKAVKNGSFAACYYLSSLYEKGEGVTKDNAKAIELLNNAADGGVAYAQCKLGDKYFSGENMTQDFSLAVKYYLLAESQNRLTPASAKNLISCYERQVSALPDLDNAEKRIDALKNTKENTKVIQFLKALK